MVRKVLCMIGIHRWVQRRNEDGEEYTECSRCAAFFRRPGRVARSPRSGSWIGTRQSLPPARRRGTARFGGRVSTTSAAIPCSSRRTSLSRPRGASSTH